MGEEQVMWVLTGELDLTPVDVTLQFVLRVTRREHSRL